jgi:hypothetical protein
MAGEELPAGDRLGQFPAVKFLLEAGAASVSFAQLGDERGHGIGVLGACGEAAHSGQAPGGVARVGGTGVGEGVLHGPLVGGAPRAA